MRQRAPRASLSQSAPRRWSLSAETAPSGPPAASPRAACASRRHIAFTFASQLRNQIEAIASDPVFREVAAPEEVAAPSSPENKERAVNRLRLTALSGAAVLVLGLAACGDSSEDTSSASGDGAALRARSASTDRARSVRSPRLR